jgi:hypothetical protein
MAQTLALDLDAQTLARAREAAFGRGKTLERVVADVVRELASEDTAAGGQRSESAERDRLFGLFSDQPELMDQVVKAAMTARERDTLRRAS